MLNILVADDNETLRLAIVSMLRLIGHEADGVGDGLKAVNASASRRYHAVLLDLQLPVMGGLEAARRMRGAGPRGGGPRIIGMSGNPREQEGSRGAWLDEFLAKPLRLDDLVGVMGRVARG